MCKRGVESRAQAPFCSARCQEQDLVNWLEGVYRLEGPPSLDDATLPTPDAEDN